MEEFEELYAKTPDLAVFDFVDAAEFMTSATTTTTTAGATTTHQQHSNTSATTTAKIAATATTIELHDDSDTDTSSENEETTIPEPLTSMFDPSSINLSKEDLVQEAKEQYQTYIKEYRHRDFKNLHDVTTTQSSNPLWMIHRAGRVTASVVGEVFKTNELDVSNKS